MCHYCNFKKADKVEDEDMEKNILKIAIDIDNTITASKESASFFSIMSNLFKNNAYIYIITNRDKSDKSIKDTKKELRDLNIHFDKLIVTADKQTVIMDENISIFFDDLDENFLELPESVTVFKIREAGNFDFTKGVHKWIYGNKTGINIDDKRNKM
jgi:uncharacterized HAD superfamily protein